jgi:oxalate decarboxylase/phosphoglucose isomerase-like protein (cupin superfamily)
LVRDRQNPDLLVPPSTDHGTLPNLRFSFADAHVRQETGGWTRQITVRELGISKEIAGVNMRLNAGGIRELHWHKAAEWAYMLYGTARITAIDAQGRNFVDDVGVGDLWYFPSGVPHSIQGLNPDGCEFLLVFDDGDFDEDNTFLLSDWFKHTPNDVLAKNFAVPGASPAHLPDPSELYIFNAKVPGPIDSDKIAGATPVPQTFSHKMLAQQPSKTKSGTVRITDTSVFPGIQDDRGGARRGRARRHAGDALASEHGRMAILHRRAGADGRFRRLGSGANLRFPGRRCWLCPLCDGALCRKHGDDDAALPGDFQEQLLRRCLAQSMARADTARVGESAPQIG